MPVLAALLFCVRTALPATEVTTAAQPSQPLRIEHSVTALHTCVCGSTTTWPWCPLCRPQPTLDNPVEIAPLPALLVEGREFPIHWAALPYVTTFVAYVVIPKTPRGGRSRGTQKIILTPGVPAAAGRIEWPVPWLDGLTGTLTLKAYRLDGKLVRKVEHKFAFRPKGLEGMSEDAIYVNLTSLKRQRLYLQRNGRLVFAALCSGGLAGRMRAERYCGRGIHDHSGWFTVIQKDARHVSTLNPEWYMPHSLRFWKAHHIHGTSPNQYRKLGRPASHGCVRLHRRDARTLFRQVRLGEKVYMY